MKKPGATQVGTVPEASKPAVPFKLKPGVRVRREQVRSPSFEVFLRLQSRILEW